MLYKEVQKDLLQEETKNMIRREIIMNDIVIFEDRNLASLLAEEISGNPNNLDCLTKENLAKVEEIFSITMLISRKEEDKIKSLEGLEWCVNLRQLHLVDHNIEDLSPLYDLENLQIINLRKNKIQSIYPLVEKSSIQTLVVGQNNIKDVSILETLTALQSVYVQENPLKNDSLLFLNKLPKLKEVCLWETNDSILGEISKYRDDMRVYHNQKSHKVA